MRPFPRDQFEITFGHRAAGSGAMGTEIWPEAETCRITVKGISGLAGTGMGADRAEAESAARINLIDTLAAIEAGLALVP